MILTRRTALLTAAAYLSAPSIVRATPFSVKTLSRPASPAINWAHPACGGLLFSYLAGGSLAVNDMLKHQTGTLTGAPTAVTIDHTGNAIKFAATEHYNFASRSIVAETRVTIWALLSTSAIATSQDVFASASNGTGWTFQLVASTGKVILAPGGGANVGTLTLAANDLAHLVIISVSNLTVNILVKRLDTGAVTSESAAITASTAPNGTYVLGAHSFYSNAARASISALSYAAVGLPLDALKQLSQDPWGPWRRDPGLPIEQMVAGSSPPPPPPPPAATRIMGGPF